MFMVMKEHATQCNGVTHLCVLIGFGQQWCSLAQRKKIYQGLVVQAIRDRRINCIVCFGLLMGFVDNKYLYLVY